MPDDIAPKDHAIIRQAYAQSPFLRHRGRMLAAAYDALVKYRDAPGSDPLFGECFDVVPCASLHALNQAKGITEFVQYGLITANPPVPDDILEHMQPGALAAREKAVEKAMEAIGKVPPPHPSAIAAARSSRVSREMSSGGEGLPSF